MDNSKSRMISDDELAAVQHQVMQPRKERQLSGRRQGRLGLIEDVDPLLEAIGEVPGGHG